MTFDHFVGQVQARARLSSLGDAVGAIRATLETLGERITAAEARDLASQLPREIGYFLFRGAVNFRGERFGYHEFVNRVAAREYVDPPAAAYHSRVVMEVASEAVSLGEMQDIVSQLPTEFEPLFAGSSGNASPSQNRELESADADNTGSRRVVSTGRRQSKPAKAALDIASTARSQRQTARKKADLAGKT